MNLLPLAPYHTSPTRRWMVGQFEGVIHFSSEARKRASMIAYAVAGHPYGKNHRGRARWEMGRRRR